MANFPATVIATSSVAYAENAAAVALSPSLIIFDDNANLFGAKITISGGFQAGQDVLSFTSQFGITGSFNAGTGVLTLSGTATLAQYQTVLRSVKYLNSSDAPVTGARTVRFEVNDGGPPNPLNILTSNATVNVSASNDRPIIAGLDTMLYTGSAQSLKQVIDADLTVTDPDSSILNGATVRITGHYVPGQDVLGFVAQGGIVGSFNAATGTLSLFGSASVAAYQAALRSITYQNTNPTSTDVADRTVSFDIRDSAGATSFASTATIMFAVAPLITTSPGTSAYTEGGAVAVVDGALTVTDLDTPTLTGATVSISVGFQAGDILAFVDTANITGSYNAATGVLTLTGTDTLAAYQAALRTITFETTNDDPPATKTVSWTATDGEYTSIPATRDITITPVNDAPVIDAQAAVLPYTENDVATVIAPATTIADPDSANFNGGTLTAAFTANGTSADQLAIRHEGNGAGQIGVSGANVSYGGVLIGTFAGGVNGADLVITFTSAAATQAAVQALARNITFANTSEDPSTLARTVTFTVVDGDGVALGGADTDSSTATVNVASVNDTAVVTTTAGSAAYTEGASATAVDGALTVTSVDDVNLASATVSISVGFEVGDVLAFVDMLGITGSYNGATGVLTLTGTTTLANYQTALRSITFATTTNDDPPASKTVSWVVNDGTGDSAAATRGITVTPVNDAPVIDAQAAALPYTENDPATVIAPATTVADPDSADFNGGSLTAAFTANGSSDDQLAIRNEGTGAGQIGVSGANVSYGGVLIGTFAGGANGADLVITFTTAAATQAAVQALARNITFANTSEDPAIGARTVTFTVVDGDGTANGGDQDGATTATVNVAPVNDAPVVTATAGSTAYTEGAAAVAVDTTLTLSDTDDTNLESATVSISVGFQVGDVLAFVDMLGITGSYNGATGVLTLTGTTTLANYQTALRSITFATTTNDDPGTSRTVEWVVNDGTGDSAPATRGITLTPVNDAPVIDAQAAALPYTENDPATVIAPATTVADPDSADFNGGSLTAAITNNSTPADQLAIQSDGNGAGQIGVSGANVSYGGTVIGTFTGGGTNNLVITFTSAAATQAAVQALARNITFANTSEDPSTLARTITFTVVDGDGTANGGDQDGSTTATVNVSAANDAPVVTPSGGDTAYTESGPAVVIDGAITVTDIDSTTMSSATVQVTSGYLNGFDSLAFTGTGATGNIAVGGFNAATGTLTLTSAGGTATTAQWQAALRLVEFDSTSPGPGPSRQITFQLDDGDGGANLSTPQVKNIAITETNSAPVIDAQAAALPYTENDPATVIAPATTVSDPDSTDFNGGSLTAAFTANGTAADQLAVRNEGNAAGQIGVSGANVSYGGVLIGTVAGGVNGANLVVTFTSAAATPAAVQALSRNITFANTSEDPSTLARTVTFTVVDGDGTANGGDQDGSTTATVNVSAANDAPVLTPSGGDTAFTEAGVAVAIDGALTVSDVDSANMSSATVQVTSGYLNGFDTLAFTGTGATGNIAVGGFNAATGTLTLTSAGGTATTAQWQAALRLVEFDSTSTSPGATREISFQLDDGDGGANLSTVVTKNIAITQVNSAPTLTGGGNAAFVENAAAVVVDGALVVNDPDTASLVGATVSITTGLATAEDVLTFTPTGSITGNYVAATGVLTLSGSGTLAEYQQVLRSVTYNNSSDTPSAAPRTIEFQVNDGQGVSNLSNVTSVALSVTPVNDIPVATASGGTAAYTEDGGAVLIDAGLTVSDLDDTNLNSATVRISGGFDAGDVLNFVNTANITGSYNAGTATLTLTGVDTVANYEAALRTITFSGTSQSPTLTKTVEWVVNDGDANSAPTTRDISVSSVNDAPQLTGSSTVGYTEDAAPTILMGGITVADVDNANILSATVSISGGFVTGQDVLTFTNSGGITGSYNAATGVLTASGSATKAQYQTFLQSVGYQNSSQNPNTADRTVSFQVDDGNPLNNLSNTVTSTVNVTATNDAPTITGAANAASYTENNPAVLIDSTLTLADAESNSITEATVTISANFTTGQDVLAFTDSGADNITGSYNAATGVLTLSGTDTLANYEAALESVTYLNSSENPVTAARTISYNITDNGTPAESGSATGTVNVTAVNDAPVNTMSPTQMLVFSNTATPITGLAISDVDAGSATNLTTTLAANDGATLTIGNGTSGGTAGIAGGATITTNGTGNVVLTGSVAQINATLSGTNVSYESADGFTTPVTPSTVTMTTNDAGNTGLDPGLSGTGTTEADIEVLQVGVLPQVWFIDSTPPGSPSGPVGSQNNPFTSVAQFNAAAALADGPGTNDYIYVQSGTYTGEGINLETGQTLLGADQPLSFPNPFGGAPVVVEAGGGVRPTIDVNVASDSGIALATGNTISGINVTTAVASAVGIADSGGTVGTLTISNMNVTGSGQAVDIDQGGALAVTIDTLSSSGGSRGLELAGSLTGSFVATAGTLSGHSVAEVDINGGSGTVSYGGTIGDGTGLSATVTNRTGGAVTLSGNINDGADLGGGIVVSDNTSGSVSFDGTTKTLNTQSSTAVQITNINGATVNFGNGGLDVDTTSGTGMNASATGGTLNVTGSGNTVTTGTGQVFNMSGVSVGGSGVAFSSMQATGTVAVDAIALDNVDGGTFSGGAVTIAGTSGATSDGIAITGGSAATFTFGTTTIDNTGADGINLNGANGAVTFTSVNLDGMTGNGISITGNTNTVNVNGGSIGATNDAALNSIDISGGNAAVTIAATSTKTTAGDVLEITGRTGANTVTLSGALTGTNSGIDINNNSGGTVNITGQVALSTGAVAGVSLATNTGATVNFNAGGTGLDITTTSGAGFTATGGGTVNVQGTGNSISTGTGTALNVVSTTIGANDLNFVSIAANGAVNGIVLNATGSSGGLNVTGTGSANTGGTITGTTGSAIVATNTQDLNLAWVNIQNPALHGIHATDLGGVNSLSNSTVSGFSATAVGGNLEDGLRIFNTNTNMTSMTVTNTTFSNAGAGNDGILMEAQGTSNMTLVVTNNTFTQFFGDAIQVNGSTGATGVMKLTVEDSDFTNAVALGNGGISMNPFGDVNFFADIDNNVFNGILNNVVTLGAIGMTNGLTANADITIRNNDLDNIIGGRGITLTADGGTTELMIDNNSIDGLGSTSKYAINVNATNWAAMGTVGVVDVTIQNNDIGQAGALWTSGNGSAEAIFLAAGFGASLDALVTGNVIDANATLEVVRARATGTGTLNATFTNNDITDTFGTHMELAGVAGTIGGDPGGNLNLSFSGNILAGGATGTIAIQESGTSTVNVQQASSGAVATANNSATVNVTGSPTFGAGAPTLPTTPTLPLLALQGENFGGDGTTLAGADLEVMADAAIARWVSAGIDAAQLELLESVTFGVADLKGSILGVSTSGLVLVDSDAAGWGWFLDATPMGDEEFSPYGWTDAEAASRIDLLSVLTHELGHILGLDDHYTGAESDVMHGYLDIGERHVPVSTELVGVPPQMEAGWGGA